MKSPTITDVKARVGPLLDQMGGMNLYREAQKQGFANLSDFLEAEDPTDADDRRLGLDAFGRMLMVKGIRTNSHPSGAYRADVLESFGTDDVARALFPEWCRRQWHGARARQSGPQVYLAGGDGDGQRAPAIYLSGDYTVGSIQRPYDDDPTLRMAEMIPAIPLSEVVARTRLNDGIDYRARRLVQPVAAADIRLLRVAEGAELPEAKITETSTVLRLGKFGRKLRATYEALRRLPLDDLSLHIRLLSVQTEVDQVVAALDVMINGDGNPSTAGTSYNLTTLDPATTAQNLTVTAWLTFLTKWSNPYGMTAVLGNAGPIIKLLMLAMPNSNMPISMVPASTGIGQSFTPMNTRLAQGQRYGITADAPADKLVGFDGRFAIEHVRESGSEISESERWITRQTEVLTFSFTEGFAVLDPNSVRILNLAA
jgi:hypothetical protein